MLAEAESKAKTLRAGAEEELESGRKEIERLRSEVETERAILVAESASVDGEAGVAAEEFRERLDAMKAEAIDLVAAAERDAARIRAEAEKDGSLIKARAVGEAATQARIAATEQARPQSRGSSSEVADQEAVAPGPDEDPDVSAKRSRYERQSAHLPKLGKDAESVLASMSELRRKVNRN